MPQKTWAIGEEVLAADFNAYVQNQVVPSFPNAAARDAWASPPNGALCITVDNNIMWQRIANVWQQSYSAATPWLAAQFLTSWSNVGGANIPAEYRRVGDIVEVHGLVKGVGGLGPIIQLPVGYRNARGQLWFPCDASGAYGAFYVASTGIITASVGANVASSFSINCSFSVL